MQFTRDEIGGSLVERFEKVVKRYPIILAIKDARGELSYLALNHKANQLAHAILEMTPLSKNPVAIFMEHTANPIIGMMGILKAGKTYVPLNSTSPDERIKQILISCGAEVVITDQHNYDRLINLGKDAAIKILNIELPLKQFSQNNLGIRLKPEELFAIIYTSGTTGIPKGVMHVQQTMMHNTWVHSNTLKISPQDRHLLISHISYVSGTTDILRTILNGASLFPADFHDVGLQGLGDVIQNERITLYHSVPTIFRRLVGEQAKRKDFSSVRILHLGGEPVFSGDLALMRENFSPDCVLLNNLGSTEAPTFRRYEVSGKAIVEKGNFPVGYAVSDKNVRIVDDEGNEAGVGEEGEIVVESKYLSWGYFKDPVRTNDFFQPVPTLKKAGRFFTGDMGIIEKDGRMKYLGRKDYQVKIHGNRVELGEVESAMLSMEGVLQAVATVNKEEGREVLAAYIVPSKGKSISVEGVHQELLGKLPFYMVPKHILIMDSFPYTQTQKIDRNRLPRPDFNRIGTFRKQDLPKTDVEKMLAKIWKASLNIEQISRRDNFFDLGGDSLTAVNLFLSIEEAFGVKLPISILLEAGDIEKQAMILTKTEYVVDWSPVVEVQPKGSQPPLFCLFGKGGNPLTFRQMAEYFGKDQPVYFLQARGLSGRETPLKMVEDIARDFIKEIKKIYPTGPYRFCGASFGGMVAYEIAQQLRVNNEEVDPIFFFDTYGPGYNQKIPEGKLFIRWIEKVEYYFEKHINSLRNADHQGRKNYLKYYWDYIPEYIKLQKSRIQEKFNEWRTERSLPPEIKEVIRANMEATARYHPKPYDGQVVLIRVSNQPATAEEDPKLGWGSVGIKELNVHEVDAYHGSIVFEPSVREVVKIMKEYF